ncbi:GL20530, partial [Drosophila persimilis]
TAQLMASRRSLSAADTNVSLLARQTAECVERRAHQRFPRPVRPVKCCLCPGCCLPRAVPPPLRAGIGLAAGSSPGFPAPCWCRAVSFIICYFSNLKVNFDHGSMSACHGPPAAAFPRPKNSLNGCHFYADCAPAPAPATVYGSPVAVTLLIAYGPCRISVHHKHESPDLPLSPGRDQMTWRVKIMCQGNYFQMGEN